jgi:hypothetical protein
MKRLHGLSFLIIAITVIGATAVDGDTRDDERWQSDRSTNDLLDRQKLLLDKQDKLAVYVQDLKKEINHLSTELSHSQSDLDEVRHELIILRVKLLP